MGFWLLILVLCHATNPIESVNSPRNNAKLYKTFDEIFGEGWGDEEKPKLLEPNESQRMEASSTENCHENSHHNEQNESEMSWDRNDRSEIDQNDNIQPNQVPVELVDSNPRHDLENENPYSKPKKVKRYSDDRKREIVQEYIELKNQFIQDKKHPQNEWKQANISKEFGVTNRTIFKWMKQFGFDNDKKVIQYSDDRKREIVQEYIELKNQFIQNKKHPQNEWKQANISKEFGVTNRTIFKWMKQFGFDNDKKVIQYSDDRKREIVQEYIELKNQFIQNKKHPQNEWKQANISKEFGVTNRTIFKWMKQFGFDNDKKVIQYSDDRKREIVQEYIELKNQFIQNKKHPQNEWKQANISKEFGVTNRTIFKWMKQFGFDNDKKVIQYSDDRKREIVHEYIELKNQFMQEKKHSQNEWKQFEAKIFKELGVSHGIVFKWKKQFGLDKKVTQTQQYSDDRKRKIVQEFIVLKNKFAQEKKHSENEWRQFQANISKELGVSYKTVFKWKKQFGLERKWLSDEQKLKKLKEYYEIKLRNPTINDTDIAADLKIPTFTKWKLKFKHSPELNAPK